MAKMAATLMKIMAKKEMAAAMAASSAKAASSAAAAAWRKWRNSVKHQRIEKNILAAKISLA